MQNLVEGIHDFQTTYFAEKRELFEQLAHDGQKPETLFITCADARVVPNLITNAGPGELITVRNVGNVIPKGLPGGTAAAIEYAIEVLEVTQIVICGHTHCGALEAVLDLFEDGSTRRTSGAGCKRRRRTAGSSSERYGHP